MPPSSCSEETPIESPSVDTSELRTKSGKPAGAKYAVAGMICFGTLALDQRRNMFEPPASWNCSTLMS
jgi:hypothetical protein